MRTLPRRVGGRVCLDFVNTVDPRHGRSPTEYLVDYESVLDWCGLLDLDLPSPLSRLRRSARRDPAGAAASHRRVLAVREALFSVLVASILDKVPARSAVERVNTALGEGIGHRILASDPRGGVTEAWRPATALDQVLWPVAIDAWDLLTEPELRRVGQCPVADGGCGWLFLDTSRSGNRRWCDMRTCGNRAKVRAHYVRHAR